MADSDLIFEPEVENDPMTPDYPPEPVVEAWVGPADEEPIFEEELEPAPEPDPANDEYVRGDIVPAKRNVRTGKITPAIPGSIHRPLEVYKDMGEGLDLLSDEGVARVAEAAMVFSPLKRGGNKGSLKKHYAARNKLKRETKAATREARQTDARINAELKKRGEVAPTEAMTSAEVLAAGQEIKTNVPLGIVASVDSPAVKGSVLAAKNVIGAGQPLVKSAQAGERALGDAVTNIREGYGTGIAATAGQAAKRGLDRHTSRTDETVVPRDPLEPQSIPNKIAAKYDAIDDMLVPDTMGGLGATRAARKSILAARKESADTTKSAALKYVKEALLRKEGMNYTGLKELRSRIGNLLGDKSKRKKTDSMKELGHLYNALTKDLETLVGKAGGAPAKRAFKSATKYAERQEKIMKDLKTLVNVKNDEGVFHKIIAMASDKTMANRKMLHQTRRGLSKKEWDEIASASLATMGRDASGNFSPVKYIKDFGKLDKFGKHLLFSGPTKKGLRSGLDAVLKVSQAYENMAGITSPSQLIQTGTAMAAAFHPILALKTMVGPYVAARIFSNPATTKSLATWGAVHNNMIKASQGVKKLKNWDNTTANKLARKEWNRLRVVVARELGADALLPEYSEVAFAQEKVY